MTNGLPNSIYFNNNGLTTESSNDSIELSISNISQNHSNVCILTINSDMESNYQLIIEISRYTGISPEILSNWKNKGIFPETSDLSLLVPTSLQYQQLLYEKSLDSQQNKIDKGVVCRETW